MSALVFCSTVIPTIGRPELSRAVESVLSQRPIRKEFEVIVVNVSGRSLRRECWQDSPRVVVLDAGTHERSVARNVGASVATGRYLHFLDDDDWLEGDALERFAVLSETSEAACLYGATRLVDRFDRPRGVLRPGWHGNAFCPLLAGEWVPLQASLIRQEAFFGAGGFNPCIAGPEDVDLLRRVALRGDLAGMQAIVANVCWRGEGSTTDYEGHADESRRARELILDAPEAFGRLWDSADNSYWRGRVVRAYLTSAAWNLGHRRLLSAAGRTAWGLLCVLRSGTGLFTAAFWNAVAGPHTSDAYSAHERCD